MIKPLMDGKLKTSHSKSPRLSMNQVESASCIPSGKNTCFFENEQNQTPNKQTCFSERFWVFYLLVFLKSDGLPH